MPPRPRQTSSPQSPDDDHDDDGDDGDDSDDGDDGHLLAPAGQVHLDPDTLLLPPASNLKSVSESEAYSQ